MKGASNGSTVPILYEARRVKIDEHGDAILICYDIAADELFEKYIGKNGTGQKNLKVLKRDGAFSVSDALIQQLEYAVYEA